MPPIDNVAWTTHIRLFSGMTKRTNLKLMCDLIYKHPPIQASHWHPTTLMTTLTLEETEALQRPAGLQPVNSSRMGFVGSGMFSNKTNSFTKLFCHLESRENMKVEELEWHARLRGNTINSFKPAYHSTETLDQFTSIPIILNVNQREEQLHFSVNRSILLPAPLRLCSICTLERHEPGLHLHLTPAHCSKEAPKAWPTRFNCPRSHEAKHAT